MWNMMCDVMPTISEDSTSQRSSQFSGEDANFEQLMVSMLDERDKLLESLRDVQEQLTGAQLRVKEVEKERDGLHRQLSSNLPQEVDFYLMLSECVRGVLSGVEDLALDCEMSAVSVRAPGLQTSSLLESRGLRVHGMTALEGVRRNLFGCTDRDENRRFVERELARQLEIDSQRWGFDFANEQPLPGMQRFAWQLVPASTVPMALRRSPMTVPSPKPIVQSQEAKVTSPEVSKTQKRITDFLKPRKRLSNSAKKSPGGHGHKHECGHGAHIRPPKVARLVQAYKRPS